MPDWLPVSVPDLCPRCYAYWECECGVIPAEDVRAKFIPELAPSSIDWGAEMTRIAEEHDRRFISRIVPKMTKEAWERVTELQEWTPDAS